MTPAGSVTVLHAFDGTDGFLPHAALIQAADGNFYGTTEQGGAPGTFCGTVFRITPAGDVTVLHTFAGGSEPCAPQAALIQGTDGQFYGTVGGVALGPGVVFTMTPGGTLTVLYSFSGDTDGRIPWAPLIQAIDGSLYGTTAPGGTHVSRGVIWLGSTPPGIATQPQSQTIASGQTATMTVVGTGTEPLGYQWYVGTSANTASPIGGATSNSYTTLPLSTPTSYWVRVSNAYGAPADSATATITIGTPPGSARSRRARPSRRARRRR